MHHVLQIPELLDIILDFATFEASPDEARATAISLALTSKGLLEQGLDRVWRDVPNILHLTHLFPRQLWKVKTINYNYRYPYLMQTGCPSLYFVREMISSDWERFDYYARRVISLRIPPMEVTMPRSGPRAAHELTSQTSIHPDVFEILSRRRPSCFPNLQALDCYENHYLELRQVSGLIGPGLRRLVFGHDNKKSEQDQIQAAKDALRMIFDHCPLLVTLELVPNGCTWSIFHIMRRMPVLPQLQHFSATNPALHYTVDTWEDFPDLIAWLSLQPSLRKLDVCLHGFERPGPISGRPFPALEELVVNTMSPLSEVTKSISMLRNAKLRKIDVVAEHVVLQTDFRDLLETMPRVLDMSVLTHFKVHFPKLFVDDFEVDIGAISTLRMLFQARNLIHLDLWLTFSFGDVKSLFLQEMATAWPNIETMSIVGATAENSIGLMDVATFARACPKLVTLGLEFDANDILNHEIGSASLSKRNTILWELRVGYSKISDVKAVASWLSQQFPSLQLLLADDFVSYFELDDEQDEPIYYQRWEEVFTLMFGHKSKMLQEHEHRMAQVQRVRSNTPGLRRAQTIAQEEEVMRDMAAQLRQDFPRSIHLESQVEIPSSSVI